MHESVPKLILGIYLLSGHPTVLLNDGAQDAIDEVLVRPGSILQPHWPAALGNRAHTLARVQSNVLALLALATGGDVAAPNSVYNIYFLRGIRPGAQRVLPVQRRRRGGLRRAAVRRRPRRDLLRGPEELPGRVHGDGVPATAAPLRAPPGLRRAGALPRRRGVVRELELLADEAVVAIRQDNILFPPAGVNGGHAGRPGLAAS